MLSPFIDTQNCIEVPIGRKGECAWLTPASMKGFSFDTILGSGTSGTVFGARGANKSEVAIKTQFESADFKRECELVKEMSKMKICPRFLGCWVEEGVSFMATEKWDISLWDWIKQNNFNRSRDGYPLSNSLINKLKHQITRLHKHGFTHGDLMEKNIMLRLDKRGRPFDISITDFGLTMRTNEWNKHLGFLKTLYDYHLNECNFTDRYFREKELKFADVVEDPTHLDRALIYYMITRSKEERE